MNIKLVASDLDGTIIDRNNNISKKNFDAIKKIHKKHLSIRKKMGYNILELLSAS